MWTSHELTHLTQLNSPTAFKASIIITGK
jgi:hypothetical protein